MTSILALAIGGNWAEVQAHHPGGAEHRAPGRGGLAAADHRDHLHHHRGGAGRGALRGVPGQGEPWDSPVARCVTRLSFNNAGFTPRHGR
ncbi:hypothetical protein QJS66_18895 [Kocuria rhizophila]|nr:hypothetical protein QJS66_18895 [Kocuria rhizophila]